MGDAPRCRWRRPALGPTSRGHGATDLRPPQGGPRGCAPRLRSPRRAALPRRSTPPVATAPAGAGCRRHRRAHRRRRAELPLPPARRPTRRSVEPGRHPAGRPHPSVVARRPRPCRQHRRPRVRPGRHLPGAGGVAEVAAMRAPSNQPRRHLGATGPGQRRRPARSSRGERGVGTPRHDRHAGPHRPGAPCRPAAASGFARARRRRGRRAVGRRHLARGAPVGPAAPIAGACAPDRAGPVPADQIPCGRYRPFRASAEDRPGGDHASGRPGRARRHGSRSVPWRSSVLAPRRAPA
jgi:hypothetical protein